MGVALPQPRTQSVSAGQLTAWPGPGGPLALLMQTLPPPGLLCPAVPTSLNKMPYYPKDVKSWDKSIATATPAAAIFFCEFLVVFTPVLRSFQEQPPGKF